MHIYILFVFYITTLLVVASLYRPHACLPYTSGTFFHLVIIRILYYLFIGKDSIAVAYSRKLFITSSSVLLLYYYSFLLLLRSGYCSSSSN
ncbi:hypothetical protein BDF22DRAFT_684320 [Syncephalis plumigaleata]|nr:hypothetical protein BDF22DRAFT_684320 [Syncephalis plumigaleata]